MKLKLTPVTTTQQKSSVTKIKRPELGTAEVWHSQEIKQSANYQSVSASYGVKLTVADNEAAIKAGIKRAENLVEAPLIGKTQQQRELLASLSQ